jgi:hypothetical protein
VRHPPAAVIGGAWCRLPGGGRRLAPGRGGKQALVAPASPVADARGLRRISLDRCRRRCRRGEQLDHPVRVGAPSLWIARLSLPVRPLGGNHDPAAAAPSGRCVDSNQQQEQEHESARYLAGPDDLRPDALRG